MTTPQDRVVLVTGAASGIGRAVATRFAAEGCRVVALDRNSDGLTSLCASDAGLSPVVCDLTDHAALDSAVLETVAHHGRIDVLVNNAGFSYYKLHADSSIEEWRQTQAVNIEAMYAIAKRVTPIMTAAGYGRIINMSSTQARAAASDVTAYAASKGAVEAWTRALAVELAPHGILVNAVAPGCIHTPMCIIDGVDETLAPDFQEWYVRRRKIPLARPGAAEEVAAVVWFLSGDQCTYMTGQTLVVDGGLTITF
jgi:NAD(P)-dependent dehydrogenase (short-subunit alcohol dehydrogenase family)